MSVAEETGLKLTVTEIPKTGFLTTRPISSRGRFVRPSVKYVGDFLKNVVRTSPSLTVFTLVNVYVDLLVFTRIAGTSYTGSGRYWCSYYIEKHAICLKDYRIRSFLSIQYVNGDLCKHLGIDSSTDHPDRYSNLFLNAYINRHVHA